MTTPPRESSSFPRAARLIAFWMVAQVAALALAAGRVSLSARFFQPAERMAVEEMLVAQLLVCSLTFPLLLKGGLSSLVVTITAIPMILLANAFSQYSLTALWLVIAYVELWLLSMACWAHVLRTLRRQLIGVCVSSVFTIFLTVLWYLAREYRPDASDWAQYFSPIVAALRLLDQSGKIWAFAAIPVTLLVLGIVVRLRHQPKPSVA